MTEDKLNSVALIGKGLAFWMSAAALSKNLPSSIKLTLVETGSDDSSDLLYGQVLPPEIYSFHLSLGLTEPDLLLQSQTSFVYGTQMAGWGPSQQSWVQAFHEPLPVWDGAPLYKLVQQIEGLSLQSLLVSAIAGQAGVFAHPPEDKAHPLSKVEYGYAFDPFDLSRLYKTDLQQQGLALIQSDIQQIDRRDDGSVEKLHLANGQTIDAQFFIDCTGPDSIFRTGFEGTDREISARLSRSPSQTLSAPLQTVTATETGWQSEVGLRSGRHRITVSNAASSATDGNRSDLTVTVTLGRTATPWIGNHVSLGTAACVLEPFTVGPIKLLLKDIDRLIRLLPIRIDMKIETAEYNRLFEEDSLHAALFNQAHFLGSPSRQTAYWSAAHADVEHPKLTRKKEQYESRGHLVAYDHEPFDVTDWAILMDGLGVQPRRKDPLASLIPADSVQNRAEAMQNAIHSVIPKIPPHPLYMSKLLSYLQRKYARHG